ncbi:hypothetical protein [Methylophilus sp. UBA6697]|uniref:hypothetical protein n=1 Tax=Methylophilus sp. UBA6697 TaxID=1946902 RepID=UPI0025D85EB5|nr:hypothetical protein [Methylophilus sp. UBA6697]
MALYQISDNTLIGLQPTSFQEEKLWERRDLQKLIKNNIDVIAGDVMVIAEEFGQWEGSGRRIDLLAVDKLANLVVIELKRTDDGGHMELQALRYAAMVSNMTWDQLRFIYSKYLQDNQLEYDAESKLCDFFGWDEPREEEFAQDVRIILASANFSKEITTSVLWLNDKDLDITCMRLSLHKLNEQLILSSEQIIPLPEAEAYQIEVKQKKHEERISKISGKDRSLFSISYSGDVFESGFKKSDISFYTIKLLEKYGLIDHEVFNLLRNDLSSSFRLLKLSEEITEKEKRYTKYRWSREPEFHFEGKGYYIARNWGIGNIQPFIEKMQNRFEGLKYTCLSE